MMNISRKSTNTLTELTASRKNSGRKRKQRSMLTVRYVTPLNVLPPKFVNVLKTLIAGVIPAATALNTTGYAIINAGSVYQPFNSTQLITAVVGSGGIALGLISSGSVTNNPQGYSLMSSIYGGYRVLSFKLKMKVFPTNAVDNIYVVLSANDAEDPQTTTFAINATQGLQFVQRKDFQYSNSNRHTIQQDLQVHKILGLTEAQYYDLPVTTIGAQPTTNALAQIALNMYNDSGNTTFTGNVSVYFELDQIVEWSSLNNV